MTWTAYVREIPWRTPTGPMIDAVDAVAASAGAAAASERRRYYARRARSFVLQHTQDLAGPWAFLNLRHLAIGTCMLAKQRLAALGAFLNLCDSGAGAATPPLLPNIALRPSGAEEWGSESQGYLPVVTLERRIVAMLVWRPGIRRFAVWPTV